MTDVASNINKILSEYLKGNKKLAYVELKKISKEYPSNEKLKFNLAFMEQDQGNIQEAKKGYLFLIDKFKIESIILLSPYAVPDLEFKM